MTTSHRKALMRNLVTALLEHGEIQTTLARAKELRKYFDKMIGHGKKGTLHARRQALRFVRSKSVVAKLFQEYAPLYKDRNGGYTRIFRLGNRLGDNAQMALIQMVGLEESEIAKASEKELISELKEDLQEKEKIRENTEADTANNTQEEKTEEEASVNSAMEKSEVKPATDRDNADKM